MRLESGKIAPNLGSFGRVFVAEVIEPTTDTGTPKIVDSDVSAEFVAVKRLTKKGIIQQRQVQHLISEVDILRQIKHPFIVRMLDNYKDDFHLYIVMEFVQGGEFFTYLRKRKNLAPANARFYAAQVALVFKYIHSMDIIYRDLKPENLLIDLDGYLKVTDFGFAKHVPLRTYTLCGTPEYIAPEVLLNKGHGKAVDWWTLGILIYEMITGYPPFYDNEVMNIYNKVLDGKMSFPAGFDR